jgi:hypothetical protein
LNEKYFTKNQKILELTHLFKERFWKIFWVTLEHGRSTKEIRDMWGRSESSLYQKYQGKKPITEMIKLKIIKENPLQIDRRRKVLIGYPLVFSEDFQKIFRKNKELMRETVFRLDNLKVLVNNDLSLLITQHGTLIPLIHSIVTEKFLVKPESDGYETYKKAEMEQLKGLTKEQIELFKTKFSNFFEKITKYQDEQLRQHKENIISFLFPSLNIVGYLEKLKEGNFFERLKL